MEQNEQNSLEKAERKERLKFRYLIILISLDVFLLIYLVYEMITVISK